MATSSYEKTLEKARRDAERQARDAAQRAREDAMRTRAGQIVAGQPLVGMIRIMDESSEEILHAILRLYDGNATRQVRGKYQEFPEGYHDSLGLEFEKLCQYGMVTGQMVWLGGIWELNLTPKSLTYFENKERALEAEKIKQQAQTSIFAPGSNIVFGNVTDSTLSIDNSITQIEKMIDEKGGEDAAELKALLSEVQELLENMKESRHVPRNSSLFTRLSDHFAKHGWFYGSVIGLLGTAAMQLIQG